MSEKIWEPWTPEIGQPVRIRISGECELVGAPGTPAGDAGERGHRPEEDGRTGVVIEHPLGINAAGLDAQGHRYRVRRDGPLIGGYRAGVYAAIELEPLAPPAPAPGAEDDHA